MERDFKISEIPEQGGIENLTDLAALSGQILIPSSQIQSGNITNYTVDLVKLATLIIGYVNTIPGQLLDLIEQNPNLRVQLAQIVGGVTPGSGDNQGQSGGNSQALEALAARVSELENTNNWPVNYITLKNGNVSVPYALPTGYKESGIPQGDIVIEVSSVTLPNLYVQLIIGAYNVNNGTASVTATLTISNFHDTLKLRGTSSSLGAIRLFGSITTSNSQTYTIESQQTSSLTFPNAYSGGSTKSESITFNLSASGLSSSSTINKISLKCSIRGIEMNGSAERYAETSRDGVGYITLS